MKKKRAVSSGLVVVAVASVTSFASGGISVNPIGPDAWNIDTGTMNANLGIDSSYIIESFESPSLTYGLSIAVPGHSSYTRLDGPGMADEVWSGSWGLVNHNEVPQDGRDVTLEWSYGLTKVGFSLSHLEQQTFLLVNGTVNKGDVRSLPNFVTGGPNVRNGYVWIEATDGDLINSVTLDGLDLSDSFVIDHIAWVPTPGSSLVLAGAGLIGVRRRR